MCIVPILALVYARLGANAAKIAHQRRTVGRGVLVVDVDPEGPSKRAGLLVGDIITSWNAKPIDRVRDVMHLLGPESVSTTADLGLVRGGASATLKVVLGERPIR